jgi:hypothetical protein
VQYFPIFYEDIIIIIIIIIITVVVYVTALFQQLVRLHILKIIKSKRIYKSVFGAKWIIICKQRV